MNGGMNGGSQGRGGRWIRVGLVVGALIAALALIGGSADAAVTGARPVGSPRINAARDAAARPGITLAGNTSQSLPSFFKLSGDGRTVTIASIALNMTCTSGAQFAAPDGFARIQIRPNGRLRATFAIPPTATSSGVSYSGTDTLTARLNRRRSIVSGVWQLTLNYNLTNGMSDRCSSGPVRFADTA